jgi:NTE family protein
VQAGKLVSVHRGDGGGSRLAVARKPRIGLALGSGAARGWAHIGVIRALERAGIVPDVVCGTSIGALVGAVYAAGELDRFEDWVRALGIREVVGLMDLGLDGGLLKGERLMEFLRRNLVDRPVEQLPKPFATVATSLHNGAEVWLRNGSTVAAVRASIGLPGLFSPVLHEGTVLVDGGLVNPVPVSLARAMGAEVLVAVDLGTDILGRHVRGAENGTPRKPGPEPAEEAASGPVGEWMRRLRGNIGNLIPSSPGPEEPRMPSMIDVMATSINIMQVRIARSRMAGDPPDMIVAPRLSHLGLLDFHRGAEAIDEGQRAVERAGAALAQLRKQLG